jgi:hypothetical protein
VGLYAEEAVRAFAQSLLRRIRQVEAEFACAFQKIQRAAYEGFTISA